MGDAAEKQDDLERNFKSFSIIFILLLSNARWGDRELRRWGELKFSLRCKFQEM
jgi:hypothetical protein